MTEDFIHYIWRYQRFDQRNLHTTDGESIQLLRRGDYNHHAGPDFTDARIRIGDTLWVGNIEIHCRSAEWYQHQHDQDPAYRNVILHVVLDEDRQVFRSDGSKIPCLTLRERIPPGLPQAYFRLLQEGDWVPCQHFWPKVTAVTKELWLDRQAIERLEERALELEGWLEQVGGDWETLCFQVIARSFGLPVNKDPFLLLSQRLPLTLIGRHRAKLLDLEALLFGQAGLLDDIPAEDPYALRLQQEYHFLRHKYQLESLPGTMWKMLRMRPANFPTVRIAQFAALLFQTVHLFDKIRAVQNLAEIQHLLTVRVSPYWRHHYRFGQDAAGKVPVLGPAMMQIITINAIVPLIFAYGRYHQEMAYQEKALAILEQLPPEDNHQIRAWKKLGYQAGSAFQTQALYHLKKRYCDERQCLHCAIGHHILQAGSAAPKHLKTQE